MRESNGYTSSRWDLSSLAGEDLRFRIGTDAAKADYGWFVDDVRVYTCEGATNDDTTPPFVESHTPTRTRNVSPNANLTLVRSQEVSRSVPVPDFFKRL